MCKSPGVAAEDFSRAQFAVFLIGGDDVHALRVESITNGYLDIIIPQGLPVGIYDLKALWAKNEPAARPYGGPRPAHYGDNNMNWKYDTRCLMCSFVDGAFALTDVPSEETDGVGDYPVVRITSYVDSYGYDGLSAFETAVLRGLTDLESESSFVRPMNAEELETLRVLLSDAFEGLDYEHIVTEIALLEALRARALKNGDAYEDFWVRDLKTNGGTAYLSYLMAVPSSAAAKRVKVPEGVEGDVLATVRDVNTRLAGVTEDEFESIFSDN